MAGSPHWGRTLKVRNEILQNMDMKTDIAAFDIVNHSIFQYRLAQDLFLNTFFLNGIKLSGKAPKNRN